MYKCPHCGNETEELPTHRVLYDEFYSEETNFTCRCGEDFDTAAKCKICGEWTCDTELSDNFDVCQKCADSVWTYFQKFRKKLTDAEWEYLVNKMDEECLL